MQHQRGARGRRRHRIDQPAPELREAADIAVLRKMHLGSLVVARTGAKMGI